MKQDAFNTPWEQKAHRIIGQYCRESYLAANPYAPGGRLRHRSAGRKRKHVPYATPEIARALVQALGNHDHRAREEECKRLFEIERLGAWSLI